MMRTTILMAGLLAGMTGVAAFAQTATAPEAGTTPPAQAEPATPAPGAGDESPSDDEIRDMMDQMRAMMDRMGQMPDGMGPMGEMDGMGPRGGDGPRGAGLDEMGAAPNTAPLALAIYDTDGDGRITQEEIEARKAARFAAADADANGGLSAEEMVALQEAIRLEVQAARAAERLAQFDDNGDGLLQSEEIEARAPQIAPLFDRFDTDNDGGITQEELDAGQAGRGNGRGGFLDRFMGGHGRHGG